MPETMKETEAQRIDRIEAVLVFYANYRTRHPLLDNARAQTFQELVADLRVWGKAKLRKHG